MNSKIILTTSLLLILSIEMSFAAKDDNSTTNGTNTFQSLDDQVRFSPRPIINGTNTFQSLDDEVRFSPRPIIKFWKLNQEATKCRQMTWSKDHPTLQCQEKNCHQPLFNDFEEPNVDTYGDFCTLSFGQTCIKYVVYDAKKSAIYIARYCGQGTFSNNGQKIENSCRKDSYSKVEVCFCKDKNNCNSSERFGTSVISLLFIFVFVKLF
jgi:hypothetical protein